MSDGRKRVLLALLLLCGVAVALAVGLSASGGSDGPSTLVVEPAKSPVDGSPELLVSVGDRLNVPETAPGRARVALECVDERGEVTVRGEHRWPFQDDGSSPLPHAHQPAAEEQVERTARCRLIGTRVELEGVRGPRTG